MSMPNIFMDAHFEKYFNFKSLSTQFFSNNIPLKWEEACESNKYE